MRAEDIGNAVEMANTRNDVLLSSPSRVKVKMDRLKKKSCAIKINYVGQEENTNV